MVPVIYRVEQLGTGWLAVMARPRSGEWAADEFSGLARLGVTDIVSLLEAAEASELDLGDEASLCAAASMTYRSFPIADRGVPRSASPLSSLACELYHAAHSGRGVAIHCRAGIGRSGLVAAAVLLHDGRSTGEALRTISLARGVQVPDTPEQEQWLRTHLRDLTHCHLNERGSRHGQPSVV